MDRELLEAAEHFAAEVFARDSGGHDLSHTLRVADMAERLARAEGAEPSLCRLAALLHDVDDYKLSPSTSAGKDRAVHFLTSRGEDPGIIALVREIIGEVAYLGTDSVTPRTLEGKCVQDADRLDALGALGAARAFAYGGSHGRAMYDPDQPPLTDMDGETYRSRVSTTLNHFYEKLFRLPALLNTDTARRIAAVRTAFLEQFVTEFLAEWEGRR